MNRPPGLLPSGFSDRLGFRVRREGRTDDGKLARVNVGIYFKVFNNSRQLNHLKILNQKKMSSPFKEVEKYIYEAYLQNYESLVKEYKASLDGAHYTVDGAKLQCLSTILELNVDKCYVGKSMLENAGNGLFAKTDLLEGQVVTFYPADVALYVPNGDADKPDHVSIESYSQRFETQFGRTIKNEEEKTTFLADYAYDVDKTYRIMGSPHFKDNSDYLGHFINDGIRLGLEGGDETYLASSSLKANSIFYHIKDLLIAIVATKDIQKGDEIYIKYGVGYWKNYHKQTQTQQQVGPLEPAQ